MFNTAVTKLNAPPVSVVLNWKASYDQSQGDLIDMSQAVPGYTAHNDMLAALAEAGVAVDEQVPLIVGVSTDNRKYLQTKAKRSGHILPDTALEALEGTLKKS